MAILYEWILETVSEEDGEEEIRGCHFDELPVLLGMMLKPELAEGENYRLGLVRNKCCKFGGLIERHWAYVVDGDLPAMFVDAFDHDDGTKVPKCYQAQFISALQAKNPF